MDKRPLHKHSKLSSIHLPRSRSAVFRSLFRGRKFLKLLKRLTVGQAVPEIPLSVGSKLELLLRAFVFANFPYTSPYTHAFVLYIKGAIARVPRTRSVICNYLNSSSYYSNWK